MQDPHALINAYIDLSIDDAGFDALCQWLALDHANRIAFAKAMADHAAIADWSGERMGGALMPELSSLEEPEIERAEWIKLLAELDSKPGQAKVVELVDLRRSKRGYLFNQYSPVVWGGLAAAVLLIGVLLALSFMGPAATPSDNPIVEREPATKSSPMVATLTATHNARWSPNSAGRASALPVLGSKLHANDRLTLTSGFAEITTNRGAIAILESPATVELLDNNALYLHAGKLVGICETPSSKGFLVRTPHMDITDLGTEFGVDVADDQVSATVFVGEIAVTPPGGKPQQLTTDQTATLSIDGNDRKLVIDNQLAAGFAALREQQALFTPPPIFTSEDLILDPNWHITAINGKTLDSPRAMSAPGAAVKTFDAFESGKKFEHYPSGEGANATYQIETSLRLPADFDGAHQQLAMKFRVDNKLQSLRVNGTSVPVPNQNKEDNYRRVYTMTVDGPIKPGDNHIAFEIRNIENVESPNNPVGIQVAWELQPAAAKQAGQTP